MPIYYPGTNNLVTHSFEERQFTAEFDDALLDQASWKNSRYDGSKLTAQRLNKFSTGDKSYQNLPVIPYTSTALYIANTVVGGTSDPQYATLKKHSYVSINKILLINQDNESVQILDRSTEPFQEFHRFITNDFPAGAKCKVKIIDESIGTNLQGLHRVKMNKGWLLKSFDFQFGGEFSGSKLTNPHYTKVLTENNSLYLFKSGSVRDNMIFSASFQPGGTTSSFDNKLRFRYGVIEMFAGSSGDGDGHNLQVDRIGPSYASSSILENKFTRKYYSGSFGFIQHLPYTSFPHSMSQFISTTGLGSASRFLGVDSLSFLAANNADTSLTEQEKTEIHVTFFEGTKDFAPGKHDERSIGTFEVDQNVAALGIEDGGVCNGGLPTNHELVFKGNNDTRFLPTINTFQDDILSAHATSLSATESTGTSLNLVGCTHLNSKISSSLSNGSTGPAQEIQQGIAIDRIDDIECYVQGGALGEVGFVSVFTASNADHGGNNSEKTLLKQGDMTPENFYSGSFRYEMSFLDKDHTLIIDIDNNLELPNGIGDKGLLIMPINIDPQVAFNIEYYLEKAGIISDTTISTQRISRNTNTEE